MQCNGKRKKLLHIHSANTRVVQQNSVHEYQFTFMSIPYNYMNALLPPDINECSTNNGGCAHNCTNTQGSFRCSCRSGFQLASDRRGCNGKALLVANSLFAGLGFNARIFPLQTSMNVALTMVDVLTTVPTPRALSDVAAEVDSS